MSTTVFRRPARRQAPEMPSGELELQEPPVLAERLGGGAKKMMTSLPMMMMSGGMMGAFILPSLGSGGASSPISFIFLGVMGVGMVLMGATQMMGADDRKARVKAERRDYLRYLGQIRAQVRDAGQHQRSALTWRHPTPEALWSVALSGRLWERRGGHADFAEVRLATGPQSLAVALKPMRTKPIEDLEPLSARALRRFIAAYREVDSLPSAVFLRGFACVRLRGEYAEVADSVRAILAQLATFHSPDDLRIGVCAAEDRIAAWDWVKWLPHAQHPTRQDGAGALRLVVDDVEALEDVLLSDLAERGRFEAAASPGREEPFVVIVADGIDMPPESRLAGAGFRNTLLITVTSGDHPVADSRTTLRLDVTRAAVEMVRLDRSGKELRTVLGVPDRLSEIKAAALARTISPYRLAATTDIVEPMITDFDLGMLLGIGEIDSFDPHPLWRRTTHGAERLRVPIGVAEDGSRVELDIKEAAQGGMGPHGLLIGATGSGKSELLRTLVLALAMTHSSETLNFVLTDFKGGATFLGLEDLPHTSAVITNLADEAALVTRMQDALQGEMNRRQELLRSAGKYSSLLDYETARRNGAALDPLPTLFVVVDEFSELLATHPDFGELFIMIGRLGRSLGVHLLLASQRLDDGRMHKLESHLSYRISLRTFSAMESRSVIGVPDAYQLPGAPGNGYIRTDVSTLTRFKAAYVSGKYQRRSVEERQEEVRRQVVVFGARGLGERTEDFDDNPVVPSDLEGLTDALPPVPDIVDTGDSAGSVETIMSVAVDRLRFQGPPAHQVWLPPLHEPATLDQVLPPLVPDPDLGLTAADWPGRGGLVVPIGLIDKPYEQIRDLFMLDLSGVGGHVGIAGGPQSGKSTLLRSIICTLALTHTPAEVQFYCLDFGGGSLATLSQLPHVGSVAGRRDAERVSRTVAELTTLIRRREQVFSELEIDGMASYRRLRARGEVNDPFGDVFLVVDGWASLRTDFEVQDAQIRQIAMQGLAYGVHVMLCTGRWSDIHSNLRDLLGSRVELRLGDSIDSMIDIRAAAQVPRTPGRGLTMDKKHYLATIPRIDGRPVTGDLSDATRSLAETVDDFWSGPPVPEIRLLPAELPAADLPPSEGRLRVALGLSENDLAPVWHDFSTQPHLTVLGDTASGKSAALRLIARAIVTTLEPHEARVLIIDSRRALIDSVPEVHRLGIAFSAPAAAELITDIVPRLRDRLPGPDVTPAQLARRDWWDGEDVFVLVDDYDLLTSPMGGPLEPLVELVPQAADIGLHIVLSRAATGSMRMASDSVIRRLQEANTPDLVLSCPPNEMLLNNSRGRELPPGRGTIITRRSAVQLQLGWTT